MTGRRLTLAALLGVLLAGCGTVFNLPINRPIDSESPTLDAGSPPRMTGDVAVALSFSGGGTRAAAFAHGVLTALDTMPSRQGGSYLDRVVFISGVSGGSVAAAYFGLKGRAALGDFRERFLLQNAEESLDTRINLANLVRGIEGGVNDSSRLPAWLDRQLFNGATLADLHGKNRPLVWINASDLFNRTPFHFTPSTFAALCSDVTSYPVSQAVAASAAVPVAFAPIVLKTFPDSCRAPLPPWVDRVLKNPNSGGQARAFAQALIRYRDPGQIRYVKLADGGLVDNFGLAGLVIAREISDRPYSPLNAERAVQLRRLVFIVVNAGRGPAGNWALSPEGPSGRELLGAVTDTAIDAAAISSFDAFRLTMNQWETSTRKWRCGLSAAEAKRLGAGPGWRCDDVSFDLAEVSFDQLGKLTPTLNAVPTRLRLEPEQVELVVNAGIEATRAHPVLRGSLLGR
ncbi:patatin-like phospholipase family protein [Blastochloris sulfoviridis]|uniref:Patatin-like phospholipase family protein n=1 Tax=Blastochloris sulfoviridis TaxID=50712 RepID=A0A5M6I4S9_9HYPH|nr:patatin-like phospholipase family protein [Blastochloris sulfoviridis]KAA5603182.1 patatin-like phospholipase family protein [Blastochloris sulfoviridis]